MRYLLGKDTKLPTSIRGESTCTATPEYLVTQGKREVGQTLTPSTTTLIILFLLNIKKKQFLLQVFTSTVNSTCWYHSLSLAPISCNNITQISNLNRVRVSI